jgi:hypothetical protein
MFNLENLVRRPMLTHLRDTRELSQYYQYRAIPRYGRFYSAYVKSEE